MLIRRYGNNVLHKTFQLCGCIHMLTRAIASVRILSELEIALDKDCSRYRLSRA